MPDLDQGGTFRPRVRTSLGPSVGWIDIPQAITRVLGVGTVSISPGTAVVTISVNGSITIQLPAFKGVIPAITLPGQVVPNTLSIIDVGGFAASNPITILPATGELINGQISYPISSNFGAVVLQPDAVNGGCAVLS